MYAKVVIIITNVVISRCCFAEDGSEVRAARAARLFLDIQPMKVLICGVVVAVLVVDAKGPL